MRVLGAALGAVGASVTMPPQVTAVLMITVAVVMTILGTRLTGLSPRIATWSPTLPMGLGRRLGLGDGGGGRLLGRPRRGPRRRLVLPALRLHPGRPDLRALDRLAALRRRDHGGRSRSGPRPGCSRSPASRSSCRARCARPSCGSSASSSSASPSSMPAPACGSRASPSRRSASARPRRLRSPARRRGGRRDAGAHDLPGRGRLQPGATCRSTRASRRAGRSSRPRASTCAASLVVPELGHPGPAPQGRRTRSTCPRCRRARSPTPARWGCTAGRITIVDRPTGARRRERGRRLIGPATRRRRSSDACALLPGSTRRTP